MTLYQLVVIIAMACCCLGTVLGLGDKLLTVTKALPNGAASITTDGIDLETTPSSEFLADLEFEVIAPALTTALLPDTQTITYIVETSATVGFDSITTFISSLILQTGAGGAGAPAVTRRFRLPSTTQRYVRIKATKTGAANAAAAFVTFRCLQLS